MKPAALCLFVVFWLIVWAPSSRAQESPTVEPAPVALKGSKATKPETREKIRDAQVQQKDAQLEIRDLKLRIDALEKISADFDAQIQAAAQEDAAQQHIDLKKFHLDIGCDPKTHECQTLWIPNQGDAK